jgi:hypothetical protein
MENSLWENVSCTGCGQDVPSTVDGKCKDCNPEAYDVPPENECVRCSSEVPLETMRGGRCAPCADYHQNVVLKNLAGQG